MNHDRELNINSLIGIPNHPSLIWVRSDSGNGYFAGTDADEKQEMITDQSDRSVNENLSIPIA